MCRLCGVVLWCVCGMRLCGARPASKATLLRLVYTCDAVVPPRREITGAEYSKASSDGHTAGYSIRFPRLTAERADKTSDEATTMGACLATSRAPRAPRASLLTRWGASGGHASHVSQRRNGVRGLLCVASGACLQRSFQP